MKDLFQYKHTVFVLIMIVIVGSSFAYQIANIARAQTTSFIRELEPGMTGGDVLLLQRFYTTQSDIYPEGLITGYYGILTEAATRRFQAEHGLPQVGRVGPLTLGVLDTLMNSTSNTSGSLQNSRAPTLGDETVRSSTHSATFTWMTDKPAYARVYYGTTWPFTLETAPSFIATGGLSTYQSVTISGLPAGSTFYYVLESKDAAGEVSFRTGKTFITQKE